MFCSRVCLNKWRKDHVFTGGKRRGVPQRTDKQKRVDKRAYDVLYRAKNKEKIRARKKAYYEKNKDAIEQKAKALRKTPKYKLERKRYLASEKYKTYKHKYDRKYRCQKLYGEYWEAGSLLIDIEHQIAPLKYEVGKINNTINKAQKRKREWKSLTQSP